VSAVRTCPNCGVPVADGDEFCGNCGTYLGWDADPTAAPATQPATQPAARPVAQPAAGQPAPAPAATPPPATAPGAEEIHAVQPGKALPRRPPPLQTAVEPITEATPCPHCGTPNAAGRRFCRHCGRPLTAPVAAARLPWWRRLRLPRRSRLGDSGRWLRRLVALLVLIALVVAGFVALPAGRRLYQTARDKIATPQPIAPSGAHASAEVPGHPGSAAVDGLSNRYWGAPAVGASITFTFGRPFRLLAMLVQTGAAPEPEKFGAQARASELAVAVTSTDGTVTRLHISLADKPGGQQTDTGISDVVSVRIVITAAAGLISGRHIALGEIEFFRR
jgi:zinc-ribbon domain